MEDKLSQGEYLEQGKGSIDSIQQQTQDVICRIFFVRHGKTTKEENESQDIEETLSEDGKEEIRKAGKILLDIGCNPEDTLILYSGGKEGKMQRIIDSIGVLQEKEIGFKNFMEDARLDTTEKKDGKTIDNQTYERARKAYEIMSLTNKDILDALKANDKKFSDYKNIVLLGHRANSAFKQNAKQMLEEINIGKNTIHTGEILESDVGENFDIVPYHIKKDVLWLRNDNRENILTLLQNEEGIKDYIKIFIDHKINIFELQNVINAYFKGHPELYEKYLALENEDLRVFCLVNLLKEGDELLNIRYCQEYEINNGVEKKSMLDEDIYTEIPTDMMLRKTFGSGAMRDELPMRIQDKNHIYRRFFKKMSVIEKAYQESNFPLSLEEKRIFLQTIKKGSEDIGRYMKKIIIQNFILKENLREKEEREIFDAYGMQILYEELRERKNVYNKAVKLQKKSIDEIIKNQDKKGILERNIIKIEKNQENNGLDYKKINNDGLLTALYDNHITHRYILSGHVGQGKSIWIAELVKKIAMDPGKIVNFIEGSDLDDKEFDEIGKDMMGEMQKKMRCSGIVKFFNRTRGSGIITPVDGGGDILVDKDDIIGLSINDGDVVEFTTAEHIFKNGKKTTIAKNVSKPILRVKCIDAIDEIKDEKKKELIKKKIRQEFDCVIATSRVSEYNDKENKGYITLNMEPINKDIFIDSRIYDQGKRKIVKEKIEQSGLVGEIESNPLLLSFVCILANEEGKYGDIGVSGLNKIKNKSDLYENITKLIIYEHQRNKPGQNTIYDGLSKKEIKMSLNVTLDVLDEFSYMIYQKKNLGEFYLRNHLNKVNILLKKTGKNSYGFVHKSFEDYFFLRGFKKFYGGNKLIFDMEEKYKNREVLNKVFWMAIEWGDIEVIKIFIENKLDIHRRDRYGNNALMLACKLGYDEVIDFLLKKGMDLNVMNKKRMNAFMIACLYGYKRIAEKLIDKYDINAKGKYKYNALLYACESGKDEIVDRLLEKGIDPQECNENDENAFMVACRGGYKKIAEKLIDKCDKNSVNSFGNNAFNLVCMQGGKEIIERLINEGIDINNINKSGSNAFMTACIRGNIEIAEYLLKTGRYNIHFKNKYGNNAFMMGFVHGRYDITKWLFDKCDRDVIDKNGEGSFLLDFLRFTKKTNKQGRSLMLDCVYGREDFIAQYDINLKNKYCKMGLVLASKLGYKEVFEIMLNGLEVEMRKKYIQDILTGNVFDFLDEGYNNAVEYLFQKSYIDIETEEGKQCLIILCKFGHKKLIEKILNSFDTHLINKYGDDMFVVACLNGHRDLAEWVISFHKIILKGREFRNIIKMSCRFGYTEVIDLLFTKSLIVDIDYMYNRLLICKEKGQTDVVKTLERCLNSL